MQPSSGGFLMKPDMGAVLDVLSEVLELVEMLRDDVITMLEQYDVGESDGESE